MRTLTKFLTASAVAASLVALAPAASAAVLISFNGSSALAGGTFAGPGYDFIANCSPTSACGGFASIEVSGSTGALPTLLHSATVDATTHAGAAGDLTIWVTRNNISSADFNEFESSFTSNNTGNGPVQNQVTPFSVTMETFVSSSNALFGGSALSTYSNSAAGAAASNEFASGSSGTGLYSVTEMYTIHATSFGVSESSSPSIILSGAGIAVPEPATWGLMLVGFGGMGALLRNRRRTAAVAA